MKHIKFILSFLSILAIFNLFSTANCATQQVSLIIFPFENLTQNKADEWIGNGFAETLTTGLAAIGDLNVIERNQLKNILKEQSFAQSGYVDQKTAVEMGKILSANIVVVGSFQKVNNQIKVTARVVDVMTGKVQKDHVADLQGKMDDIFDLQNQLADKIVKSFNIKITQEDAQKVTQNITATKSVTAYENFIKGKEIVDSSNFLEPEKAMEYFQKAVEADPDYAMANAYLSSSYGGLYQYNMQLTNKKIDEYKQKAEVYADKALKLNPDLPAAHRAKAKLYIIDKNYDKAEEIIKNSLKNHPNDIESIVLYFEIDSYKTGLPNFDNMINELEKFASIDKDNILLLNHLASTYWAKAMMDITKNISSGQNIDPHKLLDEKSENVQKTVYYYTKILQRYPSNYTSHLMLAMIYNMSGRVDLADSHSKQAFAIAPESTFLHTMLGSIYNQQGKLEEAEKEYKKLLELNPDSTMGYNMLGSVYKQQNKTDLAITAFENAIKYVPANIAPSMIYFYESNYMSLSEIYIALKQYDKALKICQDGIKFSPESVNLHMYMGSVYTMQNNCDGAINEYNVALDMINKNLKYYQAVGVAKIFKANILLGMGGCYAVQQKDDNALSSLKESTQILDNPIAYKLLMELYMKKNQYADIIETGNKLINAQMANAMTYFNLGNAYLYMKNFDAAEKMLKKSIELKPDFAKSHYSLGLVYWNLGNFQEAANKWQDTLKADPNHTGAKEWLPKAIEKIKK